MMKALYTRVRDRIHGLVNRGSQICDTFVSPEGTVSCVVCGYASDVHLLRDVLHDHFGTHLSHCNFGENSGECKYGEPDCPALSEDWAWLGIAIERGRRNDAALEAAFDEGFSDGYNVGMSDGHPLNHVRKSARQESWQHSETKRAIDAGRPKK